MITSLLARKPPVNYILRGNRTVRSLTGAVGILLSTSRIIMLMGPSGTAKTFIASGLCADAVEKGYKAYFRTMEDIVTMLKLKDVTRSAQSEYKRLVKANLIVIDDIMLFPVEKKSGGQLLQLRKPNL